jgi:hypothetical protein
MSGSEIAVSSRRLNTGTSPIDAALLARIELADRTDAEVGRQMEKLYFAPPAGCVKIALTVGDEECAAVAGKDPKFLSDPGGALLRQIIAKIQDALMTHNREPANVAYVKARDIARHLGNEAFVNANQNCWPRTMALKLCIGRPSTCASMATKSAPIRRRRTPDAAPCTVHLTRRTIRR